MAGQTAEFQLTEKDFQAAARLYYAQRRWWWFAIIVLVVLFFELNGLIHPVTGWTPRLYLEMAGTLAGTALILILVLELAQRFSLPWQARRYFARHKALRRPRTVSWDDDELATEGANFNARTPWTDIRRWRENKEVVVLYVTERLFHILPKRVLNRGQLADLVRTLRATVASKPGKKRMGA